MDPSSRPSSPILQRTRRKSPSCFPFSDYFQKVNPRANVIVPRDELKNITVEVKRNLLDDNVATHREVSVKLANVAVVRRPGEGSRPLFDRDELKVDNAEDRLTVKDPSPPHESSSDVLIEWNGSADPKEMIPAEEKPLEDIPQLLPGSSSLPRKIKRSGAFRRRMKREAARLARQPIIPREHGKKETECEVIETSEESMGTQGTISEELANGAEQLPTPATLGSSGERIPSPTHGEKNAEQCNPISIESEPAEETKIREEKTRQALLSERRPSESVTRMTVVPQDYPERLLTKQQGDAVEAALHQKILNASPDGERRFDGCYFKDGAVHILCVTPKANEWLLKTVASLTLEGIGSLRAVLSKDLMKRQKVSVLLPTEYIKNKKPKFLLNLLGRQNAGLRTETWRIYSIKTLPKSLILWLGIDELSMETLAEKGWKAHFALGTVMFKFLGKAQDKASC